MKANAMCLKLLVAAGLWMATVPATALQFFDATNDFSIVNGNPNGAWSYGWTLNDFSGFTLYVNSGNDPTYGVPYWNTPGDTGTVIWKNTHSDGLFGVTKGWLSLQPYNNTQNSVLRWTAPESGDIDVAGQFLAGSGSGQLVWVRLNNNPWWSSGTDSGSFSLQTTVVPGNTVDFVVSGSDYFGSTPLTATINLVPEPSTLGLLSVGLTVLMRRRFRGA